MKTDKIVWIDITNSPHVLFFEPVIKILEKEGFKTVITARDFASTISLLEQKNIKYKKIGRHGGTKRISKAIQFLLREIMLFCFLINKNVILALGHASYDSAVIAHFKKIKSITTFDYEYAETIHRVLLKYVDECIVPKYLNKEDLTKFGINEKNIYFFNGLKENVYLHSFKPNIEAVKNYIDEDKVNILIRPPAEMSEYYRDIKKHLIIDICQFLETIEGLNVLVIPRTPLQYDNYKKMFSNFNVIKESFDGPQLLYWSDLVISSGGTMIREAAALGTKAISTTDLNIGSVDTYLINEGKLHYIDTVEKFKKIELIKEPKNPQPVTMEVFNQYFNFIKKDLQ